MPCRSCVSSRNWRCCTTRTRRGVPPALPELPVQYADYAAWQQAALAGEAMQQQLAYWRERLQGDLPVLELPTDGRRQIDTPEKGTAEKGTVEQDTVGKGGWQSRLLSAQLSTHLGVLAQSEQVTLFTVMLAAFDLLLCRLAGQEDIVIGTPVAGRNHPDIQNLAGLFLNTLVLRTDLSGNPTFYELLRRVQETTLGAYSNQDLPFERLVEELQPHRHLHRNPLFDVLINFFSQSEEAVDASEQGYDLRNASEQDPKLPLTFYIDQYRDQIGLRVLYQQTLFAAERMRCLLEQYEYLLEQVAAHQFSCHRREYPGQGRPGKNRHNREARLCDGPG